MAQIVIRGIDDALMRVFRDQAKASGKSVEQAVRELIEDAAQVRQYRQKWFDDMQAFREKLRQEYGEFPDSATIIREARESR